MGELANDGFLVENDRNELVEVASDHLAARQSGERISLVVAPSMACNLDCSYCFEANRYAGRMDDETQDHLVQLVRRYFEAGTKRLTITWYGGEPLLALGTVERLSWHFLGLCDDFGAKYSASIVTNGTLLTDHAAQRLAACRVARAQITLDGVPELHDERRVPKDRKPTFYKILDAIQTAARHMSVATRINVCRQTAPRLEEVLQILAARGLNSKTSVYIAPLRSLPDLSRAHPAGSTGTATANQSVDELNSAEAAELVRGFGALLRKYGFATHPNRLPMPRATACIADHEHSWVIEANGDVQKCYWTAGLRNQASGRLTASGIKFQEAHGKWRDWSPLTHEKCKRCVMLPLCMGLCPLRQLAGDNDCCPVFAHNWARMLGDAFGLDPAEVRPVHLPLAGLALVDLTYADVAN
ncbi:MAG: radical SAM protein [bacterium]